MPSNYRVASKQSGDIAAILLGAALFILAPLLYLAPLGAAAALPTLAVLAAVTARSNGSFGLSSLRRNSAYLLPVLVYMALSACWALDSRAALWLTFRLGVIAFASIILFQSILAAEFDRLRFYTICFGIGLGLSSIIVLLDLLTGTRLAIALHGLHDPAFGPNTYSRGSVFAALSLCALSAGLWNAKARFVAIGTFGVVGATILTGSQLSAKVALALSICIALAVWLRPPLRWALPCLVIVLALTIPFAFPLHLPADAQCWLAGHKPSALHRIYIWNFVSEHIRQRSILGWGLDAARRLPGGQALKAIRDCHASIGTPPIMGQLLPLHPHNGILQIWLELGGVGALLVFGALALSISNVFASHRQDLKIAPAIVTGSLSAILSVAAFSFGVWQEWWLSTMAFAVLVTMMAAKLSAKADP